MKKYELLNPYNIDACLGEMIYHNPLSDLKDTRGWQMEGRGAVTFPLGRMRMEGTRDPEDGQAANIVHWCDQLFPDDIGITWDFYPIQEPGLAILFFSAKGKDGQSVLAPDLKKRSGPYDQYHSSDINALHVSYFRQKQPQERAFSTCNLRKSRGFHLVAQGADPIPSKPNAIPPYHMTLLKTGPRVAFAISHAGDHVVSFDWVDDRSTYGPVLTDGMIGFRQMAPLIAEYANLKVYRLAFPNE